jgi:glutathione S-transferase
MLTLYQTQRAWKAPNTSPFCTKLETYLRMADIPYQLAPADRPFGRSPRGKVPYILFEGQLLADSSRIIAHLKERLGDVLDGNLSAAQQALGHLVQRTLEENSYWAILYQRWHDDANWEVTRRVLFGSMMSAPLSWVIPDLSRRRVLGTLFAQGTSRHDRSWVLGGLKRDISAVSLQLGDQPYLFGERPSSFDAVIYAFTSSIWKTPFGAELGAPPANIGAHLERIHQRYFPELT